MNYHQLTKVLLVLSCLASDALAGLLPGGGAGGSGYQYNRPGGTGGFGGGPGGFQGDLNAPRGSDFGRRPSGLYGAPTAGGDAGFGRPSTSYGAPGQFGGGGPGGYQDGGFQGGYGGRDNGRPQPYSFQYEVYDPPSGNDYSQRESSDGNVVQGEYRVLLPDSRTQIVKYTADDANGYVADVQYEGQAQFSRGGIGSGAYGAPGAGGYQGGQGGYQGAGTGGFGGPSSQYGAPTTQYGAPNAQYGAPSATNQYLPPRGNFRK